MSIRFAILSLVFVLFVPRSAVSALACGPSPVSIPNGNVAALVEAIDCANASPGNDVINLASNGTYTLTAVNNTSPDVYLLGTTVGANGFPTIASSATAGTLTINGNGAVIIRSSGAPQFRFFYIKPGGALTLTALTLSGGATLYFGGAVFNVGSITTNEVTFTFNRSVTEGGSGGAILNLATAVFNGGAFTNNLGSLGVAIGNDFLGSYAATLDVNGVRFVGNTGFQGAAIYNGTTAVADIEDSTMSANVTIDGSGGAIFNNGTMTIADSTLSDNQTNLRGGGIFHSRGTLNLINSTLSGNSAGGIGGGALFANRGIVHISNSTLTDNETPGVGGAIALDTAVTMSPPSVTLENTLIANNSASTAPDISGTVVSDGYNLIGSTSGATITGVGTGNLTNAAASPLNLGVLADNGGPTQTHALLLGSVAIDAGDPAFTAPPATDQRGTGFPRVKGGRLDIGAFESPIAASLTVQLTLQGRANAAPHPSYIIAVHTQIRPGGGGALIVDEDYFSTTTGQITLTNLPTGTFTLWIKGTHTLARAQSVTLSEGSNTVTTALLLEGDADDSNVITIIDFSILATSFGQVSGNPGFDSRADFNGDGVVNILDFSLLAVSFGQGGTP